MNGVFIGIEPVIVRLGPFALRWFGVLLILALLVGLLLTLREADAVEISGGLVVDAASWATLLGLLGARLFNLVEHWEYYTAHPAEMADLGSGGLNIWGGFLGGGLAVWWLGRRRGWPLARLADAAAPGLALGELIGRIGCFLNGDGQGLPSDAPWATRYGSNDALTPDYGVPRHPAQLYQALADLAVLGLLWRLRGARLPAASRFWVWLSLYGLSRLALGWVRLDPPLLFGLQQAQWLGLAAVLLGSFAMIRAAWAATS